MTQQKPSWLPIGILLLIAIGAAFVPAPGAAVTEGINTGDTAWMLVSSGLVLLMTPGLAYFYGGMVNHKNVISTMLQSFIAMGVITVIWVVFGFSLAFGETIGGVVGNPLTYFMFQGVFDGKPWSLAPTIPFALFAFFQMKFAVITPALISGALAERINFRAFVLFMVLFCIVVYAPLAHWTWHPEGFLFKYGILDFAGGTVVHMSAGWAALAGALYLKRRKSHIEANVLPPVNIPYVLLGTGLLWFGWFGFNAGSALSANGLAVSAFATTNTAAAAAGVMWMFFDVVRGKKPSVLGFCIGAVVGLVAITPAAGYVSIPHSIFIGAIASLISNIAVSIKSKSSLDDTLDVFPCHGIGGMVGVLMTGIFASKLINPAGNDGLFFGNVDFFLIQLKTLAITAIYSFTVSYAIFKLVNFIDPIRVSSEEEELGLDESQHSEKYSQGTLLTPAAFAA